MEHGIAMTHSMTILSTVYSPFLFVLFWWDDVECILKYQGRFHPNNVVQAVNFVGLSKAPLPPSVNRLIVVRGWRIR